MTTAVWQAMRTIFLADAHINSFDDPHGRRLLGFLEENRTSMDCLCILGDLFDFRVGLPQLAFCSHEPLLDALLACAKQGTRIIYLEGNHDFQLGEAFARRIGAELHTRPVTLSLAGKLVHLCHGDLINRGDVGYRLMYRLFRSSILLKGAALVPASLIGALRRRLQSNSKKSYHREASRWDYPRLIREYAASVAATGCSLTVMGHFHRSHTERVSGMQLVVLGDWMTGGQYAELTEQGIELHHYPR